MESHGRGPQSLAPSSSSGLGPISADGTGDSELLARVRRGDEQALGTLVRVNAPRLFALARGFLPDVEEAQQAVQEALLSAVLSIRNFHGQTSLAAWLRRLLIQVCLTKLRSREAATEDSLDTLLPTFLEDGHERNPARPWREIATAELERSDIRRQVVACIRRLPESHRVVLLLRDVEGCSREETAELLGLTIEETDWRLHRARQALRELLDPFFSA